MLLEHVARHWWLLALRGVLAIIFGVLALIWPAITLVILTLIFGAFALVDGVAAAAGAVRAPSGGRSALVFEAIAGIAFGLAALFWPGLTLLAVSFLVGFWAIITGIGEIATAIRLREQMEAEWLYALFGAISVIFGVLVVVWPATGLVAIAWVIGLSALVLGASMVGAGLRLRTLGRRPRGLAPGGAAPAPL